MTRSASILAVSTLPPSLSHRSSHWTLPFQQRFAWLTSYLAPSPLRPRDSRLSSAMSSFTRGRGGGAPRLAFGSGRGQRGAPATGTSSSVAAHTRKQHWPPGVDSSFFPTLNRLVEERNARNSRNRGDSEDRGDDDDDDHDNSMSSSTQYSQSSERAVSAVAQFDANRQQQQQQAQISRSSTQRHSVSHSGMYDIDEHSASDADVESSTALSLQQRRASTAAAAASHSDHLDDNMSDTDPRNRQRRGGTSSSAALRVEQSRSIHSETQIQAERTRASITAAHHSLAVAARSSVTVHAHSRDREASSGGTPDLVIEH